MILAIDSRPVLSSLSCCAPPEDKLFGMGLYSVWYVLLGQVRTIRSGYGSDDDDDDDDETTTRTA